MISNPLSRLGGPALRQTFRSNIQTRKTVSSLSTIRTTINSSITRRRTGAVTLRSSTTCDIRSLHSSPIYNGIMPDSADPAPKESEAHDSVVAPADLTHEGYHQLADQYLEELVNRLEQEQDKRQDLEVEYASGVMEISIASKGTYVLNKQPPNKQIWLSSPQSGPKRFDWVVMGESINQKEGGGVGDWIYLRDGTSLTDLIRKELGIELGADTDVASTV